MALFQERAVTLFCLIGCIAYASATAYSNLIKWVNISQVSISDLEPVGGEIWYSPNVNWTTYLARSVCHDSLNSSFKQAGIIPGKYFVDANKPNTFMSYTVDGIQYQATDFEVLTYPRGSVSWIAKEKVSPLDIKVVGGFDPITSELLYLCRFAHKLNDTFARLTPGKLMTEGDCLLPYLGELATNSNYEVLVVNEYGKYLENV